MYFRKVFLFTLLIQLLLLSAFCKCKCSLGDIEKDSKGQENLIEKSLIQGNSATGFYSKSTSDVHCSLHKEVGSKDRWLALHYELCPKNLTVKTGRILGGDILSAHRFDNKTILFASENRSGNYLVEIVVDFLLIYKGQIVLCCSGNCSYLSVKVYNSSYGIYIDVINITFSGYFNGSVFNFTDRVTKLNMKIEFRSSEYFSVSLYHLVGITHSLSLPLYYRLETPDKLRYKLAIDHIWSATKVVMENLTKFMKLEGVYGPPTTWNFSEHSMHVLGEGALEVYFTGYDVWNCVENNLELTLNLFSGANKIDIKDVNASYRLTYRKPFNVNTEAPLYECWITLHNPNPYDLFSAPVKVVVNNSWINMLSVDKTLGDVCFYIINGTQIVKLSSYLRSWDGRDATFYLKIPHMQAFSKQPVLIRYGGAPINSHENLSASSFGYSLRDIASSSLWMAIEGSVSTRFYEYSGTAAVFLQDSVSPVYSKAIFLGCISGTTEGVFRVSSYLVFNEYWFVEYYPIYVDGGNFVKLTLRKDIQSGMVEIRIVQRRYGSDKLLYVNYDENVRYPLDHILAFKAVPLLAKLYVDTFFCSDNLRLTASVDVDFDLMKSGWHMALAAGNITGIEISVASWSQSIDQQIFPLEISESTLICNITYQLIDTPWRKLNESKITVSPNSIVEIRIFDEFGSEAFYLKNDLNNLSSFNVTIDIGTPVIKLLNSRNTKKELYISTPNRSLKLESETIGNKILVLSPGSYLVSCLEADSRNFSIMILDFLEPGVFMIDVTSLETFLESVMSCDSIKFVGLVENRELDNPGLPNRSVIMLCACNYSDIAKVTIQFSETLIALCNRALSDYLAYEFSKLDELVTKLVGDVKLYGTVTLVRINFSEGWLSYVDDSGPNYIKLNQSQMAIVNALMEASQIFRHSIRVLDFLTGCMYKFLHEVIFDHSRKIVAIKYASNLLNIVINFATGEICLTSSWGCVNSYLKFLTVCFDLMHIIGGLKPALHNVTILSGLYFEATINNRSLDAALKIVHPTKLELEHLFIDLSAYLVTISRPDISGATISFNALSGTLLICGKNIDFKQKMLLSVRDCLLNGQRFESLRDKGAVLAAYRALISKRVIEIIDYYSSNSLNNGLVKVKINNTVSTERSLIEFWTLSGATVFISVWDMMGNLLEGNVAFIESSTRLLVKLGSINILNDLEKEVLVEIYSNESTSLVTSIQRKSYITVLLKTNMRYDIRVFVDNNILLNTTALLVDSNKTRPSYLLLISEQSGSMQALSSGASLGSLGGHIIYAIISIIAITCAAFIIKRVINKVRERQIISAEKLLESLAKEGAIRDGV